MSKPYAYLIGWSELDRWYYGIRFAKKAHPDDLWVTYFTSSKHVKAFAAEHGPPTIKQIRKIFEEGDVEVAREYEHKVLRRLKVVNNDKWLNETDNKSRPIYRMVGDDNHMRSPEHRKRLSENNPMTNPEIASKTAEKLRRSKTGVKHKLVTCPHCSLSGGQSNMTRYHFDNCKKTLNAKSMV